MKKSYIIFKERKSRPNKRERFHIAAEDITEAISLAEKQIDSLWEIVKVEVLR